MRLIDTIHRGFWRRKARFSVDKQGLRVSEGFTLTEMLIVSVIVIVVTGGLLTSLFAGKASFVMSDASAFVQQQSRQAFDSMVRELREAGNVSAPIITNGSIQLNFQIVRGYNDPDDVAAGCTGVCWGSEVRTDLTDNGFDAWVHYAVIGNAGNERQLVRCVNTSQTGEITALGAGCRVLANSVAHPNEDNSPIFAINGDGDVVTIELEIEYLNSAIPGGGSRSTGVLTSQVRLRNAAA